MTASRWRSWPGLPAAWTVLAVTALLAASAPARADAPKIDIALTPATDAFEATGPYRETDMTVTNNSSDVLREIHLRWTEGGPTLVLSIALAGETSQTMRLWLPAGSQLQTYRATFPRRAELAPAEATLSWPVEQVTRDVLISPAAYAEHLSSPSPWPQAMRRNMILAAVMTALAAAATLFLRNATARIGALLVVLALASAGGVAMFDEKDVLTESVIAIEDDSPQSDAATRNAGQSESTSKKYLYIVSSRRTMRWSHDDANIAPIYRDDSQLYGETMTRHPHQGASVVITPGELRLFKSTSPR